MIEIPTIFYNTFRPILDSYYSDFWNNKWKKSNVFYTARGWPIIINSILGDVFEEVLEDYRNQTNDEKVKSVLRWMRANFIYTGDPNQFNKAEFWQYASESWNTREGDCEDGAILMYKLLRNLGVPAFRLKICAGWVVDPNNNSQAGHAYLIYLSEKYNSWYIVDWCYYYLDSLLNMYITEHKNMSNYKEIWWTFNEEYMWSQHDVKI